MAISRSSDLEMAAFRFPITGQGLAKRNARFLAVVR
jgi:hypothetical protein